MQKTRKANNIKKLKIDMFYLAIFVATASIDGSHFVIAWVSEHLTPQQEA